MFLISSSLKTKKQLLSKFSERLTKRQNKGKIKEREIHFYDDIGEDSLSYLDDTFENFDVITHNTIPVNDIRRKAVNEQITVIVRKEEIVAVKCTFSTYENVNVYYITEDGYLLN